MMKRWFLLLLMLCSISGCAESAFAQTQTSFSAQVLAANPTAYLNFNDFTTAFHEQETGTNFIPSSTGTILPRQAGFDNTQANNTSASFTYNSFSYGPNDAIGDFEWNQPFWALYQIDNLNWGRSGTKVLLSKGNFGGGSLTKRWLLYVTMKTATVAQFCFFLQGTGGSVAPNIVNYSECSNASVDNPNGFNYTLFVTSDGTGSQSSLSLYVNGLNSGDVYSNAGGSYGFGSVTVAIGGSGTGYPTSTPFENIGGGTNCVATGTLNSTSGVPSSTTISYITNHGCTSVPALAVAPYVVSLSGSGTGYANSTGFTSTGGGTGCSITGTMTSSGGVPSSVAITTDTQACTSAPTMALTAPTGTGAAVTAIATPGTGATLTASAFGATMSTATIAPMYVAGEWTASAGSSWVSTAGTGSIATSDPPILVDEVAIGVGTAAPPSVVQGIFYQTKFYQGLLKTIPSTPYQLVFDNDGCGDPDNLYALATTIAAQKLGYISLAGVVNSDYGGGSQAMYRQMLDQAGLAHIPTSVPSVAGVTNTAICTTANANVYNSATPQTHTAYESAATMYRTIFAANPTKPVFIMLGGSFRGVSDLMQSAADGISSLTGAQLVAQNAANGGAIYAQGLCVNCSFSGDNSLEDWVAGQYVVSHNGSLPIYWYMGSPQNSGPGVLSTRNAKDPMFLMAATYGSDSRAAYDSLPTTSFISSVFASGVTIAITGSGTGYANSTAFTSTGGGPNCVVTGIMVSVSGVPASITYPNTLYPTYFGVGSGCTSAPTIALTAATGSGVVLTATALNVCGTVTITGASAGTTSTATCSNHYFVDPTNATSSGSPPILTWFLNSLIDPPPNGAPRSQ
jgi:hypothetical protein